MRFVENVAWVKFAFKLSKAVEIFAVDAPGITKQA